MINIATPCKIWFPWLNCFIESAINEEQCLEQKNSTKMYNSSRLYLSSAKTAVGADWFNNFNSVVTRQLNE